MPLSPYTEPKLLDQLFGNYVGQVATAIAAAATAQTTIVTRGSIGSGNMDITPTSGQVFLIGTPGTGATINQYTALDCFTATGGTATSITIASQSVGKARTVGDPIFLLGTTTAFNTMFFANTVYVGLSTIGAQTTIGAGSDGATLPQSTITIASNAGFAASGTALVDSTAGLQSVAYTGTTSTTLTGCTGGTGILKTSDVVLAAPTSATIVSNEPTSTGGYARVAVVNNAANFSAATGSLPATKVNAAAITFPASTAAWSTGATVLDLFFIADVSTLAGGNVLAWGYLTTAQAVNASGITPSFASSALTATLL